MLLTQSLEKLSLVTVKPCSEEQYTTPLLHAQQEQRAHTNCTVASIRQGTQCLPDVTPKE